MFLITQNVIWYDVESQGCKIVVRCVFDEGFNDITVKQFYPKAQHLLHVANSTNLTEIKRSGDVSSTLEFNVYPFSEKQTTIVHVSPTEEDSTFSFNLKTVELYKQVYIGDATKRSSASFIYKSKDGFRNDLKVIFFTHINDVPVFPNSDDVQQLKLL